MRIGISLTSAYRVDDVRAGARWMIERAAAARDAGLDSLFVGDHHVTAPGVYYQNVPILARLLAEWGDRPAGALFLLPLWHPVLLAEQIGTLAAIHEGRFIMQCAVGRDDNQFTGLGVNPRHRPSRFEECLETMQRLWADDVVSGSLRYTFTEASIAPVPPEPVEVWIGGSAPAAIDRAARLGDGWLADPSLTPEAAQTRLQRYLDGCAAEETVPAASAIRRDVYVGEDDEAAESVVRPILDRGYRGFHESALVFGGPETVAEEFRVLEEMGFTDVIVRNIVADQGQALACIERLARVRELMAE